MAITSLTIHKRACLDNFKCIYYIMIIEGLNSTIVSNYLVLFYTTQHSNNINKACILN